MSGVQVLLRPLIFVTMYVAVEGLPAAGKSEVLALLRLYFPEQVLVLPELVKEVVERKNIDLCHARSQLTKAILESLPARQALVRRALSEKKMVLEDSHLAVHAAYSAVLGDAEFLEAFQRLEGQLLWPDLFLRLEVPIEVSLVRQMARGDLRYAVPQEILAPMAAWLSAWHARRKDRVEVINADCSPQEAVSAVVRALGLVYSSRPQTDVFPYLILLGRPASGKSELINFLSLLPAFERAQAYHIGALRVIDDFPFLWEKFQEDDIWEALGCERRFSRRAEENYAVACDRIWDFLLFRLNTELRKSSRRTGETVVVEFSRGGPAAYRRALSLLDPDVLAQSAVLYLHVSFAESLRRNRARYDRDHRDGILTHSVPEEEMLHTYQSDDWHNLASGDAGYLAIQNTRIPYITVYNEPEPKSVADFSRRFKPALEELYHLWKNR
ncbi:MAG: hypothetical protein NZ651_05900 [Candidatus Bipolaricaulota bacterium]|nr:hypothetical protein [Candidatus Bipolaricaulota bacterium]MDW8127286.1 hypothetical protein [Candidatus Bipolaricaulota bacterium]